MIRRLCHGILSLYYKSSAKRFAQDCDHVEKTQRQRLNEIINSVQDTESWSSLPGKTYEELREIVPIADYSAFRERIKTQRKTGRYILSRHVQRYEPTSGSTEERKWIPYSAEFLTEINQAAAAWLGDLYEKIPAIKNGTHYWSLSWLPEELRKHTSSNDADLFPAYQRWILKQTMTVPSTLSHVAQAEAAWWATLLFLAADENLALVSVWSPTYWLKVSSDIQNQSVEIAACLRQGVWGKFEKELNSLGPAPFRKEMPGPDDPDFFKSLWPKLSLISAWDSSSSMDWADKLKKEFSWVQFQGKGIWATEGVLSIPFKGKKVLALQSHFFEFIDLETKKILPSWKIERGKEYQPVLWTSTGLLRYALQDRVRVMEFLGQAPCLEFLGRLQSVDLVGEKMDAQWVQEVFSKHPEWKAIALLAVRRPTPHYCLCYQGTDSLDIENELLKLHHYKVARELGQLGKAQNIFVKDVFTLWEKIGRSRIVGQNKIEFLLEVEKFDLE